MNSDKFQCHKGAPARFQVACLGPSWGQRRLVLYVRGNEAQSFRLGLHLDIIRLQQGGGKTPQTSFENHFNGSAVPCYAPYVTGLDKKAVCACVCARSSLCARVSACTIPFVVVYYHSVSLSPCGSRWSVISRDQSRY